MTNSQPADTTPDLDESHGGYEVFRNRAASTRGASDPTWRIGFDPAFRDGNDAQLASAIMTVLTRNGRRVDGSQLTLLDIGSGSGALTEAITEICLAEGITHVVVDSEEMLSHLSEETGRVKAPGRFPLNLPDLKRRFTSFEYILAYSVLQYVVRDSDAEEFIDAMTSLLTSGGVGLLGDIPNRDMRDRQFLAGGKKVPGPTDSQEIRDDFMAHQFQRIRNQGFHAFITPQDPAELMHLHRENLLIVRPAPYDLKNWIGEQ